jgi:hypothetical protein
MRFSRSTFIVIVWLSLTLSLAAQQASAKPSAGPIDDAFVQKQFGSNCSLIGLPPVTADLDGDGIEDVVIPARCTSPMMDQGEHGYYVIDPFYSFYGYGNPAITTQFVTEDPQRRGYSLLIIHGFGPEAWRSATPKAKFLVVNLPFQRVVVRKYELRKKTRMAIFVEESEGDSSVSTLFWDGKKYRYQPMGASLN